MLKYCVCEDGAVEGVDISGWPRMTCGLQEG